MALRAALSVMLACALCFAGACSDTGTGPGGSEPSALSFPKEDAMLMAAYLADEATAPRDLARAIESEIEEIRFLRRDLRDVMFSFRYVPGRIRMAVDKDVFEAISDCTYEPLSRLDEPYGVTVTDTDGETRWYVELSFENTVNPVPPARELMGMDGINKVGLKNNPEYHSPVVTAEYRKRENIYVGETETGRAYVFERISEDRASRIRREEIWYAVVIGGRAARIDHFDRLDGHDAPAWYEDAYRIIRDGRRYGSDSRRTRKESMLTD